MGGGGSKAAIEQMQRNLDAKDAQHRATLEQLQRNFELSNNKSEENSRILQNQLEALNAQHRADIEKGKQDLIDLNNKNEQEKEKLRSDTETLVVKHREAMEQSQKNFLDQQQQANAQHEKMLSTMQHASEQEKKKMQAEFEKHQADLVRNHAAAQERYEEQIEDLVETVQESKEHNLYLETELKKPAVERQQKVDFINSLELEITQNEKLLLVGMKGTGKSTFMWLLGQGEKPKKAYSDGTVEILQLKEYIDSIGLAGWNTEDLLKLLVLMIYDGIPKDLIVFCNDRINLPLTNLGLLGITHAMIVIMSSEFWKNHAPHNECSQKIELLQHNGKGVRRVQPVDKLGLVYDLDTYDDIKEFGRGIGITHHDPIEQLVRNRYTMGIRPFEHLMEILGPKFQVKQAAEENDPIIELLFRFIYVYEKKFKDSKNGRLKFMNSAKITDFAELV